MMGALVLQILGLIPTLTGAVILLYNVFITNHKIRELSSLPIAPSNRYAGGVQFAATTPEELKKYTEQYSTMRRNERARGIIAIVLFLMGFALQLTGLGLEVCLLGR